MFTDLGYVQGQPTTIFEDNESCLKLSRNYCAHDRVKHLDLREVLVREHHQRGLTELVSIGTRDQLGDQFTKVLPGPQVRRLRDWMLRGIVPADADHAQLARRAG